MEYKILKANGAEIDFDEFIHVAYYLSEYFKELYYYTIDQYHGLVEQGSVDPYKTYSIIRERVEADILLGYKERIIELNQYIRNAGLQVIDMKKQIPF